MTEGNPTDSHWHGGAFKTTLTECLFPLPDWRKRKEADGFRATFDVQNEPTDLTRRYTSTWPPEQQWWLFENSPGTWFDGLAPFAKAFLMTKLQDAGVFERLANEGRPHLDSNPLTNNPDAIHWIKQYVGGALQSVDSRRSQGR